ncbi:MAG: peptide-methionine (S)-S-oxide reductase MsrA [Chitinophagales bacterium]
MQTENLQIATFGGGCFWCIETIFQQLKGVARVESGYSGGHKENPTYKEVCTGTTGHAEVVQIYYDENSISFAQLLKVFFTVHDPTTPNRQGNDIGTQYRSVVFYHNETQKSLTEQIINQLNEAKVYQNPIVTAVSPFEKFYKAEDYHQDYYNLNPEQSYCKLVIQPKVEKFEKIFKEYIKE